MFASHEWSVQLAVWIRELIPNSDSLTHAQLHCAVAVDDDGVVLVLFPVLDVGVGARLLPAVLLTPSWFHLDSVWVRVGSRVTRCSQSEQRAIQRAATAAPPWPTAAAR